ncbi:GDNF family receptor alpha-3-like [Cherax quadricarinatus]
MNIQKLENVQKFSTRLEDCLKAWLQLRETPLLGCICPDGLDKKCSRLYSLVNENPCVESDHNLSLEQLKHVAGTCQSALEDCMTESTCRSHLEMVSSHCDTAYCHKDACRSSIQDIYKFLLETNQDLALKIALCVCRDATKEGQTECSRAQRRLHPPCAHMSASVSARQCHNLGRDCRSDRVCRYRLEHYELSCAADTMTGRCAGQHQECTKAMLGLLGTDLHTNCVCKGSAFQDINQCLAWKRLLWGNPCFFQEQLNDLMLDFNLSKQASELLVSRLQEKNYLQQEVKITAYRTRKVELLPYFTKIKNFYILITSLDFFFEWNLNIDQEIGRCL